jgi:Peroxiredoxin
MKKHLFLIFSLVLLVIALYVNYSYKPSEAKAISDVNTSNSQSNSKDGEGSSSAVSKDVNFGKAPNFTLYDLQGNKVSLSDYKGKNVYLNFWATWCPPCKAEMPELEKVYQRTKNSDLVILAVEIGEPKDTVQSFINDKGYNFKVLLDSDQSTAAAYGISAIPTSFFIDKDGNIVAKQVGGMTQAEMEDNIAKLDK